MKSSERIVCKFSCGAASAIAAKLILSEFPSEQVVIVNAFIQQEHPDNQRFLDDCEKWFAHPILRLRDEKYGASTYLVWERKGFMKNRFFAPCSGALKRDVLASITLPGDTSVLGYTADEEKRADRLECMFPNESFRFPLIERGLRKADCLAMIERAGLVMPEMYRLGYNNANCIGCVKGGEGYWNKIRRDFPVVFEQICTIQESIGPGANLFRDRKTGERYSLRDLPLDKGRYQDEPDISCGFTCQMAEWEFTHEE